MKGLVLMVVVLAAVFTAAAPVASATHAYYCPSTGVDLADAAWCGANCTWDAVTGGGLKRIGDCWGLF